MQEHTPGNHCKQKAEEQQARKYTSTKKTPPTDRNAQAHNQAHRTTRKNTQEEQKHMGQHERKHQDHAHTGNKQPHGHSHKKAHTKKQDNNR